MYKIKVWTAGHVLFSKEESDVEKVKEMVQEWSDNLSKGAVTLTTCGTIQVVKEICIDILRGKGIFAQHSFKKGGK